MIELDLSQRMSPGYMDRALPTMRPYVYPVAAHIDSKCLESMGSCVFIAYRRQFFLVTAGHVWLDTQKANPAGMFVFNQVGPDAGGPEESFIEISGSPMLSDEVGKPNDNVDLAIFHMDEEFFRSTGFSAVPERMIAQPRDAENFHLILHGFPAAANKKYLRGRGKRHQAVASYYFEEKLRKFDWSKFPHLCQDYNIPVQYGVGRNMAFSKTYPNRKNKVSANPKGMSGGALWSTPSLYLSPTEIRLHGIMFMKEQLRRDRKKFKARKDNSILTFSTHISKATEIIDKRFFNDA